MSSAAQAMRNELALASISRKLPINDLLTLRRTCSTWNHIFTPEIQAGHGLIELAITSRPTTPEIKPIRDFTDSMRLSARIPYTKYQLSGPPISPSAWLNFFSVCGPSLTTLSLYLYPERPEHWVPSLAVEGLYELAPELEELRVDTRVFQQWISSTTGEFRINVELPKLKKLVVGAGYASEHKPVHQELLNELVRRATRLEYFEVLNCQLSAPASLQTVQIGSGNLGNLRALKISELKPNDIKILIELCLVPRNPLRLTEFTAYAKNDESGQCGQLLTAFLSAQAPFLQMLDINLGYEIECQLPKMSRVRVLDLSTNINPTNRYRYASKVVYECQTLAGTFPALHTLHCCVAETEEALREMEGNSHPAVANLCLYSEGAHNCLYRPLVFPALTRLDIPINGKDDIRQLWTRWPTLESLHIRVLQLQNQASLNLDELLSGIPKTKFNDLNTEITGTWPQRSSWSRIVLTVDRIRELATKFKTEPSMSQLPRLQKLIVEFNTSCWSVPSFKMSDIGGYFGVASAGPPLHHINIRLETGTKKVRISPNCMEAIRESLGPFAVIEL